MHTMDARIPEKRMQFSSSSSRSRFAQYTPYALALLRIVAAFLFLQHGTAKFFGVPHVAALDGVHLVSLFGLAGVLEVAGGLLVLIGLFTRLAAFLLSGEMAVAYFMRRRQRCIELRGGGDAGTCRVRAVRRRQCQCRQHQAGISRQR